MGAQGIPSPNGKRAAEWRRRERLVAAEQANGAGPNTPEPERREIAARLRRQKCTWADIGALFEVSTETARRLVTFQVSRMLTEEEWEIVKLLRHLDDGSSEGHAVRQVLHRLQVADSTPAGVFQGLGV